MNNEEEEQIRARLRQVHQKLKAEGFIDEVHQRILERQGRRRLGLKIALVALILLAGGLGWYWYQQAAASTNDTPQEPINLLARHFKMPDDELTMDVEMALDGSKERGNTVPDTTAITPSYRPEALTNLRAAMQHYQNKAYPTAIGMVEQYLSDSTNTFKLEKVHYYLAAMYVSSQQPDKALAVTRRYPKSYRCQWLSALAHLQGNEIDKAKAILVPLAAGSSAWAEEAKGLLADLP